MGYCIVGIGEILWDLFPEGEQMGGAPANFAFHAKELAGDDVDCHVISCIGNDDLGSQLVQRLESLSLGREYLFTDRHHNTGTVTVSVDRNGVPSFTIDEIAAWDFIPNLPKELAGSADVVCFGTLAQRGNVSRETIQSLLGRTKGNALRIFDINLRQTYYSEEIIKSSLGFANILKINDEELAVVSDLFNINGNEEEKLRQICVGFDLELGVLTRGSQGSILVTEDRTSSQPGIPTEIVDTVGAGDAFTASIAIGLLRGLDLDRMNACANLVASYVCSQAGATPCLPTELKALYYPIT